MNHDFAKKKKPKTVSSPRSGLPAWFWLFTGIVSGLFIAFLIYLSSLKFDSTNNQQNTNNENTKGLSEQIKEQADRMREGKEQIKKPTFEFYKRLPEITIETPKPNTENIKTTSDKNYILQAGSFRSYQDADSLKVQLIMQGLDVQISSVKDSKGKDWHRVQVGPYNTQHKLNKAQDVLANNNIPSMLIEVK